MQWMLKLESEEQLGKLGESWREVSSRLMNSLCSGERWAGTQTMLGTVEQIHNFGLFF